MSNPNELDADTINHTLIALSEWGDNAILHVDWAEKQLIDWHRREVVKELERLLNNEVLVYEYETGGNYSQEAKLRDVARKEVRDVVFDRLAELNSLKKGEK